MGTTQIVEVVQVVEYVTIVVEKTITEQETRLTRIDISIKSSAKRLAVAKAKHNKKLIIKLSKKITASKRNKKDANAKLKVSQAQRKVARVAVAKAKHAKKAVDRKHKKAKKVEKKAVKKMKKIVKKQHKMK